MKVLFLALGIFHPEGGMERFNQRVVRVLSELVQGRNIESAIVLSLWDAPTVTNIGSHVYFRGFDSNKIKTLFAFLGKLRSEKPELVLYGHILFAPLALVAKIIHPKGKSILFAHGTEVWEKPSLLKRWTCNKGFDHFIVVSQFTAHTLASAYQLPAVRILTLFNAIDYNPNKSLLAKPIKLRGLNNILTVSRLSTGGLHKNIDKVIEAMPEILEKFPATHYYIVGDGDWRKDLEKLSIACGVEDHIHFTGQLDDRERDAYYDASDIFILPSVGEGFGIVFLEAWKYKLPIVTSNQGAAPEVVENGKGGLCIAPYPNTIAEAVNTLLSDHELRARMGIFGFQKLITFYTHRQFHDQLANNLGCSASIPGKQS